MRTVQLLSEVIDLKTKIRTISALLAVILVFSLTGIAAYADPVPVPGDATLNISISVDRDGVVVDSYDDGTGNYVTLDPDTVYLDGSEMKVCNVSLPGRLGDEGL